MNGDEIRELEELVRGVPLRGPSAGLDQRILAVCQASPVHVDHWWLGTAAVATAAVVTAGIVWSTLRGPPDESFPDRAPSPAPAVVVESKAPSPPPEETRPPVEAPPAEPAPPQPAPPAEAEVVGRYVFYNGSKFDGDDPVPDLRDDAAIAPDKAALMPGQTASLANYTSYSRGINGIMIDVAGLPSPAAAGVADFQFRVGNSDDPAGWSVAPSPLMVTVRRGEGNGGSDRITLIWADGAVHNTWLEVTVRATDRTALAEDDVFYFGNAIGESGNSTAEAHVNAYDMAAARENYGALTGPAAVRSTLDFNRDSQVDVRDTDIALGHQTHFLNALKLIAVPPAARDAVPPAARDAVPPVLPRN